MLWLVYPILILPQGIALYTLFHDREPALLWALVLWCVGLTLGIGVDVFTSHKLPIMARHGQRDLNFRYTLPAGVDARVRVQNGDVAFMSSASNAQPL